MTSSKLHASMVSESENAHERQSHFPFGYDAFGIIFYIFTHSTMRSSVLLYEGVLMDSGHVATIAVHLNSNIKQDGCKVSQRNGERWRPTLIIR